MTAPLAQGAGSLRHCSVPACRRSRHAHRSSAGLVERATYRNAGNGFCVLGVKARGHRDVVTVVGHTATISAGSMLSPDPHPSPRLMSIRRG
ncbi:YrrC family ATP-dependent DNA helicase [Roseomonas xinghualingensis]